MLNKESFLFIAVIVFFIFLFVTQLVALGYIITEKKDHKKKSIN
jgi:hypothetical protein